METKHTKGNWEVRTAVPDENRNIKIKTGDVISVGVKSNSSTWHVAIALCGFKDNPECHANAKLIAAAPDLLEACMAVKKLNLHLYKDGTIGHDVYMQIRAAIKKATE